MNPLNVSPITFEDGEITIAAELLADKLGLSLSALKAQTRRGYIFSLAERGFAEDAGRTRLTFRYRTRSWTTVVQPDGTLVDTPAPSSPALPVTKHELSLLHLLKHRNGRTSDEQ